MRPTDRRATRQPKANVEGVGFQSAFSIWNLGKVLRLEKYTLLILDLALPKRTGKKCCLFSLDEEASTDAIDIYLCAPLAQETRTQLGEEHDAAGIGLAAVVRQGYAVFTLFGFHAPNHLLSVF